MKKVLLFIISLIVTTHAVFAYQTVIIDFPKGQRWHSVYYDTQGMESILQYVPGGQSYENWNRTIIFHSYKGQNGSAALFMDRMTGAMEARNSTQLYKYLKYTEMDSYSTRCIQKNNYINAQCEIFRVSKSFEGLITMHYIDKNVINFRNNYEQWLQIMKDIRIYYNYYRMDSILNKSTSFEL